MVLTLPVVTATSGPRNSSWAIGFSVLLHAAAAWYFVTLLISAPVFDEPDPINAVIQPVPATLPPPPPKVAADPPKPSPTKPRPPRPVPEHAAVPPLPMAPQPPGPVEPTSQLPVETVPAPAPKPTHRVPVAYPNKALDREMPGVATVQVTVGEGGAVVAAEVTGESPLGYGFGEAALKSVRQWQFADAAPGAYTVTVKFTLN